MDFLPEATGRLRQKYSHLVQQSLDFIIVNSRHIKSVAEVARNVGVNYHTLRARFRRETRITLEECLIRVRVSEAVRLMQTTDLLIKEIAWEVGYRNEGQLTRATKRVTGNSPQVLRRQHQLTDLVGEGLKQANQLVEEER